MIPERIIFVSRGITVLLYQWCMDIQPSNNIKWSLWNVQTMFSVRYEQNSYNLPRWISRHEGSVDSDASNSSKITVLLHRNHCNNLQYSEPAGSKNFPKHNALPTPLWIHFRLKPHYSVCKESHKRQSLGSINPSAWGHLNPSSYCDVGRLFYRVFKLWSKLQRKKWRNNF